MQAPLVSVTAVLTQSVRGEQKLQTSDFRCAPAHPPWKDASCTHPLPPVLTHLAAWRRGSTKKLKGWIQGRSVIGRCTAPAPKNSRLYNNFRSNVRMKIYCDDVSIIICKTYSIRKTCLLLGSFKAKILYIRTNIYCLLFRPEIVLLPKTPSCRKTRRARATTRAVAEDEEDDLPPKKRTRYV